MKVASSSVFSLLINRRRTGLRKREASSKTPAWQGVDITSGVMRLSEPSAERMRDIMIASWDGV